MGLAITAHSNAEFLGITSEEFEEREGELYDEGVFRLYCSPGFVERIDGFDQGYYKGESKVGGSVGSYSGYGRWRKWLSETFLYVPPETIWERPDAYEGKPFVELINFSDCEGAIGPKTSAKLAKDFQEHDEKAQAMVNEESHPVFNEYRTYKLFREAFEAVAENGFVDFH